MSTHAPARLDRRILLAGLAISPLAGIAPAGASAWADSHLLALGRQCSELQAAIDASDELGAAIEDRIGNHPAPPEELFWRPSDFEFFAGFTGDSFNNGRRWYGSRRSLSYLRTHQFTRLSATEGKVVEGEYQPLYVADEAAHQRAAEIVTAHERWTATIAAIEEQSGLTAALAKSERLSEQHKVLLQEILGTPATSLAGITVKAAACAWCNAGFGDPEDFTPDSTGLALAVVCDLLRIGNAA